MKKLWYLFSTLKPAGSVYSHAALWIGIALYAKNIPNLGSFLMALLAFLLFYGALYAMNDLADYENDAKDANNKKRVIASGKVSQGQVLSFIVPIWLVSLYIMNNYSHGLAGIALILWGINILYSFAIKSVPYIDILFISFTQPIKYYVALFLCGAVSIPFVQSLPFFAVVYFIAVSLHARKQLGKLKMGSKRPFLAGEYTEKKLSILGDIALVLSIPSLILVFGHPEFVWSVLILIVPLFFRFVISPKDVISLLTRMGSIFQPK